MRRARGGGAGREKREERGAGEGDDEFHEGTAGDRSAGARRERKASSGEFIPRADIGAPAMSRDISNGDWSSSERWHFAMIMKSFMVPKTEREGIGAHCTALNSGAIQR